MKPLYIVLIIIGCVIVATVAIVVPVLLTRETTSSTITPVQPTTVPPGPPGPPTPPIPPVPPTPPTLVYPRYLYMTLQKVDSTTDLFIVDTEADQPVSYSAFNINGTFYNSSISPDLKSLYVPGDSELKIYNIAAPLLPFLNVTITYNNYQQTYPDMINSQNVITNLSGTLLFISFGGKPLNSGGLGGGIGVFQTSAPYALLQWVPATGTGSKAFYVPAGMAMNRNDQVLYVANAVATLQNTISVFTLSNNTLTYNTTIAGVSVSPSTPGLTGLALSANSNDLYSIANATNSVFVTNTDTLNVDNTITLSTSGSMVSLQPSGKFAFVGLYSGEVAAYDVSGATPTFVANQNPSGTTYPTCVATNKYLFTLTSTGLYFSRIDVTPIFSNYNGIRSFVASNPQKPSQGFLVIN